jgi:hypothetical protein
MGIPRYSVSINSLIIIIIIIIIIIMMYEKGDVTVLWNQRSTHRQYNN